MSTDCGIFTIQKSVVLDAELDGHEQRRREDEETDQRERPRRVVAVLTVEVPTDDGQERGEDPRQAEDQAAVEHVVDVEVVVEVQRLQRGWLKSPKPSAQKATSTVRMVRMRLIRERRLHRDRRRLHVLDELAEHVLLLELARGGSRMKNAAAATTSTGTPSTKNAHRHPSSPPAQVAIAAAATGLTRPMMCAC